MNFLGLHHKNVDKILQDVLKHVCHVTATNPLHVLEPGYCKSLLDDLKQSPKVVSPPFHGSFTEANLLDRSMNDLGGQSFGYVRIPEKTGFKKQNCVFGVMSLCLSDSIKYEDHLRLFFSWFYLRLAQLPDQHEFFNEESAHFRLQLVESIWGEVEPATHRMITEEIDYNTAEYPEAPPGSHQFPLFQNILCAYSHKIRELDTEGCVCEFLIFAFLFRCTFHLVQIQPSDVVLHGPKAAGSASYK